MRSKGFARPPVALPAAGGALREKRVRRAERSVPPLPSSEQRTHGGVVGAAGARLGGGQHVAVERRLPSPDAQLVHALLLLADGALEAGYRVPHLPPLLRVALADVVVDGLLVLQLLLELADALQRGHCSMLCYCLLCAPRVRLGSFRAGEWVLACSSLL